MPTRPDLREREARLVSLKLLAGRIAHDFNNYLAPILGYVTLIKEEIGTNSSALEYANSLEQSGRRSERAIETILLACRPQRRFRPQTVDFAALVGSEVQHWLNGLPATARITVEQDIDACTLCLDPIQWRNVMVQLLENAHFALGTGGTLKISLHHVQLPPDEAAALGLETGDVFELKIADNGFGMPEEVLRQAFDLFFTTRPKGTALGLGLAIIHSVVRLHCGQAVIESQENHGTTVRIWLPAVAVHTPAPAPAPSPAESGASGESKGRRKVLVVDDDPMVREVIKACLQRAGYDVHLARDGNEGLKMFQHLASEVGLVISDVTMPNMNGVDMYRQIRALDANVPVLMISGDADAKIEAGLTQLGDSRPQLIKKPFAAKGLLEEVRKRLS